MNFINCEIGTPYLFDSLERRENYRKDIPGSIERAFSNRALGGINHKFFYYSFCSTINYLKGIYHDSFLTKYEAETETEILKFFKWCDDTSFFQKEKVYDYFSIGSGDGDKDKRILEGIRSRVLTQINYIPIDFSYFLLKMTVGKIMNFQNNVNIFPLNIDFHNLKDSHIQSVRSTQFLNHTAIFSLFGNTIGNYDEKKLITAISSSMRTGDYLLIGHRIEEENEKEKENPGDTAFLLEPLKYYENVESSRIVKKNLIFETTAKESRVEGSKSLVAHFDFTPIRRYKLTYSHRYRKDALRNFFKNMENLYNLEYCEQFYNTNDPVIYSLIILKKSSVNSIQKLQNDTTTKLFDYVKESKDPTFKNIYDNFINSPITDEIFLEKVCENIEATELLRLFKIHKKYKCYLKEKKR